MGDEYKILRKLVGRGMRRWWLRVGAWWAGASCICILVMFGITVYRNQVMVAAAANHAPIPVALYSLGPYFIYLLIPIFLLWLLAATHAVHLVDTLTAELPGPYKLNNYYVRYLAALHAAVIPIVLVALYCAPLTMIDLPLWQSQGHTFPGQLCLMIPGVVLPMVLILILCSSLLALTNNPLLVLLFLAFMYLVYITECIYHSFRIMMKLPFDSIITISSMNHSQIEMSDAFLFRFAGVIFVSVLLIVAARMKRTPAAIVLSTLIVLVSLARIDPSLCAYCRTQSAMIFDSVMSYVYLGLNVTSSRLGFDLLSPPVAAIMKPLTSTIDSSQTFIGILSFLIEYILVLLLYHLWAVIVCKLTGRYSPFRR